jgi:hypothetical protein
MSVAGGFFDEALAQHRSAVQAHGAIERTVRVGGSVIRLRFAGGAMVPHVVPALSHLTTTTSEPPDLTVCIWDTASTGVAIPPAVWPRDDYGLFGEIRIFTDRYYGVFQPTGVLSVIDYDDRVAILWTASAGEVPPEESASPLRVILHAWLTHLGLCPLHGAAVGFADRAALMVGRGGSGKSTSSVASIASGLGYLGDDFCAVDVRAGITVHSLYNTAKIAAHELPALPFAQSWVSGRPLSDRRSACYLAEHIPAQLVERAPVRAVLLPSVTPGQDETTIEPASPAAAFLAIAPTSAVLVPRWSSAINARFGAVVRCIPAFWLRLGRDRAQVGVPIRRLLESLA